MNDGLRVVIIGIGQGRGSIIRTVLTNSFGFGGINAHLVLSAPCTREERLA